MPKITPAQLFASSQIVLALCLFACLAIIPHYFFSWDQGGVSNYGTEPQTRALFIIGFGAATVATLITACLLPSDMARRAQVRLGLGLLAVLYSFVALSTFSYKLSDSYRHLHEQAAIALFVAMLIGALWLRFVALPDRAAKRAFIVFCAGIMAGVATLVGVLHLLFIVQLVCGATFGYMAGHGLARLAKS